MWFLFLVIAIIAKIVIVSYLESHFLWKAINIGVRCNYIKYASDCKSVSLYK